MRRLLLAGAAAIFALASVAKADNITLTATADGTLVDTINSGGLPFLDVNNVDFGTAFLLNSLTLNSAGSLAKPAELNTNSLDVAAQATGNHQLILDVTASGLLGSGSLQNFLSEFSVTGLTTGWSVTEQTFINGTPEASFTTLANSASFDANTLALETNPFSAEVRYTINSVGVGQFNGGIDISAPVPAPLIGAGLPGLLAALGGMFGLNRFRRRRVA